LIDGGDFSPATFESNKIKAQLIRELMDEMGYDVVAVGEKELNFGVDFYRELMDGSEMQVLAANVFHGPEKERLGEDYAIVDAGGVKVGIMNVFLRPDGSNKKRDVFTEQGYSTEDAVEIAKRLMPEVRSKCDYLILLAHAPWGVLNFFLQEVSGFDFVIASHEGGLDQVPRKVHGTTLMRPGRRGQHLCKIQLTMTPADTLSAFSAENIPIKTSLPEDSTFAARIKEVTETYNKARRAETASAVQKKAEKLKGDKFLGGDMCKRCHDDVFKAWLDTPHAAAFQRLEEKDRQGDSDCVGCHTTGHGEPTGYLPAVGGAGPAPGTPDLTNVQCEACHGMGTYHNRNGDDFLKVSEAECSKCHNGEHSPEFEYKEYLQFISCTELVHGRN
jgi:2',3'-cyclic-nucleotide 2'-phosphodiesterase (5'-nucleotidase family)